MKSIFFLVLTLCAVSVINAQRATIKNVNSTEFKSLLAKKEGVLLDVRTVFEFDSGHLMGADQLNYYACNFKQSLLLLPKDKPVYVYCKTGYRSNKAAQILKENGYTNIYNLQNGIEEWKGEKYLVVK